MTLNEGPQQQGLESPTITAPGNCSSSITSHCLLILQQRSRPHSVSDDRTLTRDMFSPYILLSWGCLCSKSGWLVGWLVCWLVGLCGCFFVSFFLSFFLPFFLPSFPFFLSFFLSLFSDRVLFLVAKFLGVAVYRQRNC